MIVSGGYLLGRIPGCQNKKRCKAIEEVIKLFQSFKHDLTEYRLSMQESFSKKGGVALELLNGCEIKGLLGEDQRLIEDAIQRLKNGSYRESTECVKALIDALNQTAENLKASEKTVGKALPLVTSIIGFLIAVLLF